MLAAALLWLVLPLWRTSHAQGEPVDKRERGISTALVGVLVPVVAIGLYSVLSISIRVSLSGSVAL